MRYHHRTLTRFELNDTGLTVLGSPGMSMNIPCFISRNRLWMSDGRCAVYNMHTAVKFPFLHRPGPYCHQKVIFSILDVGSYRLYDEWYIKNAIIFKCLRMLITRQIWGIWKLRSAYSPETSNFGQNRWCFVPCDLEIWWMTLENNRASLLCCFKLCATFHSNQWIQTGVTVRKRPIWVKFDDFFSRVTLKFDRWLKKIGHLFYTTSSFVHHFVAIGELKLEPQSGDAQLGSNSTIFRAVWLWNLTDDLEKL